MNSKQNDNQLNINTLSRTNSQDTSAQYPTIKIGNFQTLHRKSSFEGKQDGQKTIQDVWHRRMMQSQMQDAQVIFKKERFSALFLISVFLVLFFIMFHFTPLQTYHPDHE